MTAERGGYLSQSETRLLAAAVERLRAERDWTQHELSERSGVHLSTLHALNRANRGAQGRTLTHLAAAFGFEDPDDMLIPPEPELPPPDPRTPAERSFDRAMEELRRTAARAGDDATWMQLTGRLRQLTHAVQVERRKGRND